MSKGDVLKPASTKLQFITFGLAFSLFIIVFIRAELGGHPNPLAFGIGGLLTPLLILLFLQIIKDCRTQSARYKIYSFLTLIFFSVNLFQLSISHLQKSSIESERVNNFVAQLQSELPYQIPSNGFTIANANKISNNEIQLRILPPVYLSNFETDGISVFLTEQQKSINKTYCSNEIYKWMKKDGVTITYEYYDLDNQYIGVISVKKDDCSD